MDPPDENTRSFFENIIRKAFPEDLRSMILFIWDMEMKMEPIHEKLFGLELRRNTKTKNKIDDDIKLMEHYKLKENKELPILDLDLFVEEL